MMQILFFPLTLSILCLFSSFLQAQPPSVAGSEINSSAASKQTVKFPYLMQWGKQDLTEEEKWGQTKSGEKPKNEISWLSFASHRSRQPQEVSYQHQKINAVTKDAVIRGQADENERKRIEDAFLALRHQDPISLSPETGQKFSNVLENKEIEVDASAPVSGYSAGIFYAQDISSFSEPENGTERKIPTQRFTMEGITLNGNHFDVKKFRGKVVLVDFFAPWCRPCIEEFSRTKKLYSLYHKKGFEVISIGADSPVAIKMLVDQHELPWTVLSDEMTMRQQMPSIMNQYGVTSLPTAYLIDPQGRLIDGDARGIRLEKNLESIFCENEKSESKKSYYEDN